MKNLIFIKDNGKTRTGDRAAIFLCFCGNYFSCRRADAKNENTKSCGCLRRKRTKEMNLIYGESTRNITYLYRLWNDIKTRCYNKNFKSFKNYGGRGITIHKEWAEDYSIFKKWIIGNLGERPYKHSLDRINNNGNYEPGNLRWATYKEQRHNQRTSVLNKTDDVIIRLAKKNGFKTAEIANRYIVSPITIQRSLKRTNKINHA